MLVDLRRLKFVEAAVYFSADRRRWVAHAPTVNVTAHGPSQQLALEALRRELDVEEKALTEYPPAGPAGSVPRTARRFTLERSAQGRWA